MLAPEVPSEVLLRQPEQSNVTVLSTVKGFMAFLQADAQGDAGVCQSPLSYSRVSRATASNCVALMLLQIAVYPFFDLVRGGGCFHHSNAMLSIPKKNARRATPHCSLLVLTMLPKQRACQSLPTRGKVGELSRCVLLQGGALDQCFLAPTLSQV